MHACPSVSLTITIESKLIKKTIMRLTAFLIPALAAFVPALAQNETDTEESGYVSNVLEALK